jgi:hypothetical protein
MQPPELGVEIARKIAAEKGVEPATLEPPVQAVIDVTALERLIHPSSHSRTEFTGVVSFAYGDYTVTVDQTGTVSVNPRSELGPGADSRPQPREARDTPSDLA